MKSPEPELVFTRIVDARRDKVFEAWTDPVHLGRWLASDRWAIDVPLADPRPGGVSVILMRTPEGETMTVMLTVEDVDGRTRYTARVRHSPVVECEVQ